MGELPAVQLSTGSSSDQSSSLGPCRSEIEPVCEHVPDRLGELAAEFDASDLAAALRPRRALVRS